MVFEPKNYLIEEDKVEIITEPNTDFGKEPIMDLEMIMLMFFMLQQMKNIFPLP